MADKDTKAIRKLKELLDTEKESLNTLADKLGIARGTLLAILSGRTSPRFDVVTAAKKLGIHTDDWGHA
jgi:transcriptional regulator with XRE-family HTH domain